MSLFTILLAIAEKVCVLPTVDVTFIPICSELWNLVCQFAGSWKLNPVQAPVLPVHVRGRFVSTAAGEELLLSGYMSTTVLAFTASLTPVPSSVTLTVFPEIVMASVLGIACPCATAGSVAKAPAKTLIVGIAVVDIIGVANASESATATALLLKLNFIIFSPCFCNLFNMLVLYNIFKRLNKKSIDCGN